MVLFAAKLDREAQAVDMFGKLKQSILAGWNAPKIQETQDRLVLRVFDPNNGCYEPIKIDRIGRIVAFQSTLSSRMIGFGLYFRAMSSNVRYLKEMSQYTVKIRTGIRPSRGATTAEIMEQLSFVDPTIAPYFAGTGGFIRYMGRREGALKFTYIGPALRGDLPENVGRSFHSSSTIVPRGTIVQMFGRNSYFFPGEGP